MKKLLGISAVIFGLLALVEPSQAQIITSIQFDRNSYGQGVLLAPTDIAGEVPVGDWNSNTTAPSGSGPGNTPGADGYGPQETDANSVGLVTSSGSPSSIGYSIKSNGNLSSGSAYVSTGLTDGNGTLLDNGGGTQGTGATDGGGDNLGKPVVLTLNGLNPADTYTFYVYLDGQGGLGAEGSVALGGGSTQYYTTPNGGYALGALTTLQDAASSTEFDTGTGSSVSLAQPHISNYVEFTGFTGSATATLTLTELGGYGGGVFTPAASGGNVDIGMSGVQVLDTQETATPEPSTYALFASGALALVAWQYRRRRLQDI